MLSSESDKLMNPGLYHTLVELDKASHNKGVKVVNQGCTATLELCKRRGGATYAKPSSGGEEYKICCPFCSDGKHRLYVSYLYGTESTNPGYVGTLKNLAYCQNEQEVKRELWDIISTTNYASLSKLGLVRVRESGPAEKKELMPMGEVVPLHELNTFHPAVTYLKSRGFNPNYLGKSYGVGAVISHQHEELRMRKLLTGRIVFPYYVNRKLVAWQSRYAGEVPKGSSILRWYYPSGSGKHLWGFDNASHFQGCILCEGILSAVNFGPAAMAIGGKVLLPHMLDAIVGKWSNVLVALDPDAGINRNVDLEKHDRQQKMVEQLKGAGVPYVQGVAWTPGDLRDPGDIGVKACREIVKRDHPMLYHLLPYYRK